MEPRGPWQLAFVAVGALGLLVLAGWAHLRFWVRRLSMRLDYASEETLPTPDGSAIELRRVPVPEGAPAENAALPPVLLVHGICANHRNQDVHPDYSLARYLARLGRDVWLLTLRSGRGSRSRAEGARMRFAAMAQLDLPLAVRAILERTGAPQLDYVAFSMGGMLLYASIGAALPESSLRRAVIVGSPGVVGPLPRWLRFVRLVPAWLVPRVPARFGARAAAFLSEWFTTPLHRMIMNPENVAAGITRIALVDCIQDVPGRLLADMMGWAARDGEIRVGGERVLDRLERVRVPALFVAGSTDRIAPPSSVKCAFEAWARGAPEVPKRFVTLGCEYGSRYNYGHGDLALGAHVGVELFEPIARFLGPEERQAIEAPGPEVGPEARREIEARVPVSDADA